MGKPIKREEDKKPKDIKNKVMKSIQVLQEQREIRSSIRSSVD